MKRSKRRKLKHDIRAAHTTALTNELGSEQAAALRRRASELRAAHGLCEHGDDERVYENEQELREDKAPPVICPECGKPRLRVRLRVDPKEQRLSDVNRAKVELFAIDLLK